MVLCSVGFNSAEGTPIIVYQSPNGSYSTERFGENFKEVPALVFRDAEKFITSNILRVGDLLIDYSTVKRIDLKAQKLFS